MTGTIGTTPGAFKLMVLAVMASVTTHVSNAHADCKAVARAELDSIPNAVVAQALFSASPGSPQEPLGESTPCAAGKPCVVVFFQGGARPTAAPMPPPPGYQAPRRGWEEVVFSSPDATCESLFQYRFELTAGSARPPEVQDDTDNPRHTFLAKTDFQQALDDFKRHPSRFVSPSAFGSAQGAFGAAETLQILGQIVVDRASNKGYTLLQEQLKTALDCPADDATGTADARPEATSKFPKTCALLVTLRIEDIAMAPEALSKALAQDVIALVLAGAKPAEPRSPAEEKLYQRFYALATSLLSGSPLELVLRDAIQSLTNYVADVESPEDSPAKQAAALGVLTLARCVAQHTTSETLAQCNIAAELDTFTPAPAVRHPALELAQRLVALSSASRPSLPELRLALDTVAATACMLAASGESPRLGCPNIDTLTRVDAPVARIAFVSALGNTILDRDPAAFIVVAAKLVDLKWVNKQERATKRSALRLLTGLLGYATTYATEGEAADSEAKHEERTKILESLTRDMTDRTGRGGAVIFSLAGALRFEGGIRAAIRTKGTAVYGPVGLPLGIALDVVPVTSTTWGFHLQLDMVNLGNYLALDEGLTVKEPDVGDAFAPGLTVAASYGQDLPMILGAFLSYTPQFQVESDNSRSRGSVNVGATFGIAVPLLDLN